MKTRLPPPPPAPDPANPFEDYKRREKALRSRAYAVCRIMGGAKIGPIKKSLSEFETDWVMFDNFYRIFHQSFKMYRMVGDIMFYCDVLAQCAGLEGTKAGSYWWSLKRRRAKAEVGPKTAIRMLRRIGMDPLFVRTITEGLSCTFDGNEADKWFRDQQKMIAAWIMARQVAWATVLEIEAARKSRRLPGIPRDGVIDERQSLVHGAWQLWPLRYIEIGGAGRTGKLPSRGSSSTRRCRVV